jgi:hypothetical protein
LSNVAAFVCVDRDYGLSYFANMSTAQTQIAELFDRLPAAEQRELAGQLYERAVQEDDGLELTAGQRADLVDAIAQSERGEVLSAADLHAKVSKRFEFAAK